VTKAIFLDIDGVLNCRRTPNPRSLPYVVDPVLLVRFRELVAETGAQVVLSSTWRYDPAGLFGARHHHVPFIDTIPDTPHQPRRDEIRTWLDRHPEVTRHAVLDDEDDELDELPLFQPSAATGLTDDIARGVARYLAGETDAVMRSGCLTRLWENIRATVIGQRG
jgi:hypothetical protein